MPVPQEITVKITTDREPYTAEEIQELLSEAAPLGRFLVEEVED